MVRELVSDPDSGLLGSRTVVGPGIRNLGFIQYWDSFDALREYARDSVPNLWATLTVLQTTPANPPWQGNVSACLSAIIGFGLYHKPLEEQS